jgi:hypothetical protein
VPISEKYILKEVMCPYVFIKMSKIPFHTNDLESLSKQMLLPFDMLPVVILNLLA